jgi:hypothetical protein
VPRRHRVVDEDRRRTVRKEEGVHGRAARRAPALPHHLLLRACCGGGGCVLTWPPNAAGRRASAPPPPARWFGRLSRLAALSSWLSPINQSRYYLFFYDMFLNHIYFQCIIIIFTFS